MKRKEAIYKGYNIRWNRDGYNVFIGLVTNPFLPRDVPNITRAKMGINLRITFITHPIDFAKYFYMLLVENRHNYNGCYGKYIPMWRIRMVMLG